MDINCNPIEVTLSLFAVGHYTPAADRDPTLDYTYSAGPIIITLGMEGLWGNVSIACDPVVIPLSVIGELIQGQLITAGPITISIIPSFSYFNTSAVGTNLVKWSKIGSFDFTMDQSNTAGERVMDWKGTVHCIKRLGSAVVVYGDNGVTVMKPHGVHYGMDTVYRIGLKNRQAIAGDDSMHLFVDTYDRLYALTEKGLERLDYSEYISQLGYTVLTYDKKFKLLYICDGTTGYIYSVDSNSFGEGPGNITGLDYQDGNLFVVSPDIIVTPKFEITTDIYDFGTRKPKTISMIELGTDAPEDLFTSIDYRINYKEEFRSIDWFLVNPDGKSFPKCYGVEFRFKVKSLIYEYLELDYIKVRGMIHGFSYLDTTYERAAGVMD